MRQLFLSALDLSNESNYVGGIIPSLFATNITNDKSLSLKLKKKKKLLAQYSSKVGYFMHFLDALKMLFTNMLLACAFVSIVLSRCIAILVRSGRNQF